MGRNSERILLKSQDEELVKLIQKGNQLALETLYKRYRGLIYDISIRFLKNNSVAQMYFDDLIDIATESFIKATYDYQIDNDNSFLNYWWVITDRQQTSFLRKVIETKVTYYDSIAIDSNEFHIFDYEKYVDTINLGTTFEEILNTNKSLFTEDEFTYLNLFLSGYKPLEIADMCSWKRNKVYRVKNIALRKLNKIIKSN